MVLPFFWIAASAVAGLVGASAAHDGYKKLDRANETIKEAKKQQEKNKNRLERISKQAVTAMDRLGEKEWLNHKSCGIAHF